MARTPEPIPTSRTRSPGPELVFDRDHGELGRRMKTRAERHAGVELDDDLARSRVIVMPGRFHQDAASDAMNAVVRFPGVGPVFLLALVDSQIADRAEPAEMPERPVESPRSSPVRCLQR